MALQVGELYSSLSLDTGNFDSGMSGVKGKLKGLGGLAAKTAAGLSVVLAGAFTAAATAGVKANSDTEQFMATMEVLTGSTEAAAEELKKLKKFAADTPFAMEDLKKGELTMRAVNVSSEKWRETIGDTAAAFQSTGKSYTDVVDAIADAQTGELERLKEFGITKQQIVDYANDQMGKSNIVNAKGQITDQEAFNDALLGLMDSRYDGMMDKQSKTMAGMIGTFQDFMSQGLEIMSKPIFDALKAGMDQVMPLMENLMNAGVFERIGESVGVFVGKVIGGFAKVGSIFQSAGGTFSSVMGKMRSAIDYVRPQIELLAHFFKINFRTISEIVRSVLGFIAPHIREIFGGVINWWKQNGTQLLINMQVVFNNILKVVQFVMPAIKFVIDFVFNAIKMIIGGALQFITGTFQMFSSLFQGDWAGMWQGVKDMVIGAVKFVLGVMSLNFVRGILTLVRSLGSGAINGVRAMWSKIVQLFDDFVNKTVSSAGGMVTRVLTWFRNMWNQARTIFTFLRSFGESIFRALFNTIRNVVMNIYTAVRTNFTNMLNSVRNSTTSIWNTVKTQFGKLKSAILNPIQAAKNGVKSALDGIKALFNKLKLNLPQIKVPKFVMRNWSKNPVDWIKAMPSVGVEWHKDGGIFNGPTVAGLGEAGPEAIVPLSGQRMRPFAKEIARQMGGAGGGGTIQLMAKLVLPDGRVIAEIAEPYVEEIQNLNAKKDKRGWGVY